MYNIIITRPGQPKDVIEHELCAESITDVEQMLTAIVAGRFNLQGVVLIPTQKHKFRVFQLVDLQIDVSVVDINGADK